MPVCPVVLGVEWSGPRVATSNYLYVSTLSVLPEWIAGTMGIAITDAAITTITITEAMGTTI